MTPCDSDLKVEGLKKITLSLEAGTEPERMNLTRSPVGFEFIFGVGKQGLTPFEYALADKTPGEEIIVQIPPNESCRMFEHLSLPTLSRVDEVRGYYLKVRIERISTPDSRAVVKTMAAMTECGENCDCGCAGHSSFFNETQ